MTTTVQPKIQVRRAGERFHSDHGWLKAWHTFSFADHYDPGFTGFSSLRVINDDTISARQGFGEHPHRDMEIITYVIEGELEHQDSMGNGRVIKAGEFQYMSAGSGVRHAEFNPSATDPVHLLQIWIQPNERGAEPRYEERAVGQLEAGGPLTLVASVDGREGSFAIRQEAEMRFGRLVAGQKVALKSEMPRHWLHVISGSVAVGGEVLGEGDGAAITGSLQELAAGADSDFILFSLS
ncbi:MAG: pirin family protein [Verrucomicrobiaceae bacterium]